MSEDRFKALNHLKDSDRLEVIARLDKAKTINDGPRGFNNASWLHSDIHSLAWRVSKTQGTRVVNGRVIGYKQVDWNVLLPDGSRLGDPIHSKFLKAIQRIAYRARENLDGLDQPNSTTHSAFIGFLLNLSKCAYLYRDELKPDENVFSRVDYSFIVDYVKRYSMGGNTHVLGYPQQFIVNLYEKVLGRLPSSEIISDPFSMDEADRSAIQQWLEDNHFITKVTRFKLPYIKPSKINSLIGAHCDQINHSDQFKALIHFLIDNKNIIITPSQIDTECFSHKTALFEDAKNNMASKSSIQNVISDWAKLISLKKYFPSELPEASVFDSSSLLKIANSLGSKPNHTPWIPLKVALKYTTEALRWIHVYGEDLVALYLDTYRYFYEMELLSDDGYTLEEANARKKIRNEYINSKMPNSLLRLNISGMQNALGRKEMCEFGDYEIFRSFPALTDAMSILIGAVLILIGITKPIRRAEISNLDTNCVLMRDGDGYWLHQHYGKRNVGDTFEEGARPIPTITAKGLLLIQTLSNGLKDIQRTTDPFLLRKLFVLSSSYWGKHELAFTNHKSIAKYLNFFCDYVAIPADEHNRRWYVRIHELRKSFLIVFFWCFKFASLEAARWIAGHTSNSEHIYAYIQANFPGEELPAIEAEYARQVMWDFEATKQNSEVDNVEELYGLVCNHFGVTSIAMIGDDEFEPWMRYQFESGRCQIVPYTITSEDGSVHQNIVFKVVGGA